jgi:hypothetical protein
MKNVFSGLLLFEMRSDLSEKKTYSQILKFLALVGRKLDSIENHDNDMIVRVKGASDANLVYSSSCLCTGAC